MKNLEIQYDGFFEAVGYIFSDIKLAKEALTHPSVKLSAPCIASASDKIKNKAVCKSKSKPFNYERLEFLGDRVLGFVIGDILYRKYPNESEGIISKRYANLVCGETCTEVAKNINLDKYIMLSKGEESQNGRENSSILENVIEAVIGAIFLDGGIDEARKFIEKNWLEYINDENNNHGDPKSILQEWSQMQYGIIPKYDIIDMQGPDHAPKFIISASVNDMIATADGSSRKAAEKEAAKLLLNRLNIH